MIKQFLKRKKKGNLAISLEVLISIIVWCLMTMAAIYFTNCQKNQKIMYDTFISAATQCSKWGGNHSSVAGANGKTQPIDAQINSFMNSSSMPESVRLSSPNISITPNAISKTDNKVHLEMTFTDQGASFIMNGISAVIGTTTHTIRGDFNSIVKPGTLVKEYS